MTARERNPRLLADCFDALSDLPRFYEGMRAATAPNGDPRTCHGS